SDHGYRLGGRPVAGVLPGISGTGGLLHAQRTGGAENHRRPVGSGGGRGAGPLFFRRNHQAGETGLLLPKRKRRKNFKTAVGCEGGGRYGSRRRVYGRFYVRTVSRLLSGGLHPAGQCHRRLLRTGGGLSDPVSDGGRTAEASAECVSGKEWKIYERTDGA